VLAPEDENHAIEALRFSFASDIVELVVLTADDAFLQTLREAVGPARRLWHVPTSDKVSDLLIAGGVGILVLDVQAVQETSSRFISEIKRQFPDLVVVVAGTREAETALARLISEGTVYRFIHKPMSPARAKLFADAAVKKYDEQRKHHGTVSAVAPPRSRGLIVGIVCAALCLILAGIWFLRRGASPDSGPAPGSPAALGPGAQPAALPGEGSPLARAALALAANRLTTPAGDNALELYRQELARSPGNPDARAGIAEVHERLLARAENALIEERLDEAAADIDAARTAGVDVARVAFLAGELAKARERVNAAAAAKRELTAAPPADGHAAELKADQYAALAMKRIQGEHLIDPERDNARFYVEEALNADPGNAAALEAQHQLALALLTAHRKADADAERQLLKSAEERLHEDRLIEPENDSAKYYVTTLRGVDPANAGLAQITQQLGSRLVVKGRYALTLGQYDAARSWLDEAAAIGYVAPEASAARRDLDAALAEQAFLANVVSANRLDLVKSVQPVYPRKAEQSGVEGWVELDFTVTDAGAVKDALVRAADPPGVFDQAAVGALLQWHYRPVMRDAKPVAQRARIRIRFAQKR
jgi:TonB family protein